MTAIALAAEAKDYAARPDIQRFLHHGKTPPPSFSYPLLAPAPQI